VTDLAIAVEPPPVSIRKEDFKKVLAVWPSYLAGNFPRSKMSPLTRASKYIISILHALSPLSSR
jgi:hypothetical protein